MREKNSNTMKTNFTYLDSLREEISHGYHEANQIVAQAKLNYTYLKAPNGRPSKLRLEDWILVRTKAFKEKFGDWETAYKKRYLLYHEAVKQLSGNEFEKQAGKTLQEQILEYYDSFHHVAISPFYGDVILDKRGINDSYAHGIGRKKAVAFAAVKEVIEQGVILIYHHNHKGRNYNTVMLAAPINIGIERYICQVILIRNKKENRFYLHEVTAQKNLHNDAFITNLAQKPASLGDLAKVLQDIVCASDLPKFFFDENGEPRLEGIE